MHSNNPQGFYQAKFHSIHYSQQIPTKQQQIYTLKTTISSLNQERQNLKQKMKAMVSEVSNYHQNVVQKVSRQNQKLKLEIIQFKDIIKDNVNTISKLTKNISKLENNNHQLAQRENLLRQRIEYLQNQMDQLTQRYSIAQESARGLNRKQSQMANKISQYERKNQYLIQQLAILNKKYEKMILYSQRTKVEMNDYVEKEKYKLLQKEIKINKQELQKLRQANRQLMIKNQRAQFDRLSSVQSEQDTKIYLQRFKSLIQTDLQSLKLSLKMQDSLEIQDLKSEYRFQLLQLSQAMRQIINNNKSLQQEMEILEQKMLEIQQCLNLKQSQLQNHQEQLKIIKTINSSQPFRQQQIANKYEAKIAKIQLQLKREENSLSKYQEVENELTDLKDQYANFCLKKQQSQQENSQKLRRLAQQIDILEKLQTNTNLQLEYQMKKTNKLPFLFQLISHLLTVVPYLHCLLLRLRQRNRKIYMPFMTYYFRVRQQFQQVQLKGLLNNYQAQHRRNKSRKLRKFRRCVQAIRATIRMKKHLSQKKQHIYTGKDGFLRYVAKAIECKDSYRNNCQKIAQMLEHSETMSLDTFQKIIRFGKITFSSSLSNYHKIQLHQNDDVKKIGDLAHNLAKLLQENQAHVQQM